MAEDEKGAECCPGARAVKVTVDSNNVHQIVDPDMPSYVFLEADPLHTDVSVECLRGWVLAAAKLFNTLHDMNISVDEAVRRLSADPDEPPSQWWVRVKGDAVSTGPFAGDTPHDALEGWAQWYEVSHEVTFEEGNGLLVEMTETPDEPNSFEPWKVTSCGRVVVLESKALDRPSRGAY